LGPPGTPMPVIATEMAEAGMVLAADVVDRQGRCLIPAGAELSERTVQALGNWGVESVQIEGEEIVIDDDALAAAKEAIAWRFAHTDTSHPFMAAVLLEAAKLQAQSPALPPEAVATDVTHA